MWAAMEGHLKVVKYLIESGGADINSEDNVSSDEDEYIYYNIIIADVDVTIICSMERLH